MNGRRPEAGRVDTSVGDRVGCHANRRQVVRTIAKAIGVARSLEAFGLFVDAIAARPARERAQLRAEENLRLDAIERRNAKVADEAVRERRQASLEKLRARLIAIA